MYFIALVLPAYLNDKILVWKNFMQERYNCKVGLKSPAHITLIPPFWMEENKEAALFYEANSLANNFVFQLLNREKFLLT
jgi:2'-5' RNA ligase